MTRKYAGLPLWAWGILGAAAIYLWYRYTQSGSTTSPPANTPTSQVLDPNAIDPNTGLTYGQEEQAALGQTTIPNLGSGSNIDTGNGVTSTDTTGTSAFDTALSDFETVAQLFGPGGVLGQTFGATPASTPTATPAGLTLSQVQGHFAALFPTAARELQAAAAKPPTARTLNASTPSVRPQTNPQQTAHITASQAAAKAAAPLAGNKTAYNKTYNAAYNKAFDQAWLAKHKR